jgi:predicted NBD/HSP70 family sugar kinase
MKPLIQATLDPDFQPAVLANHALRSAASVPLVIGLEREDRLVSRYQTVVRPTLDAATLRHVDRLVKFLLWARGGWRLYLDGPGALCAKVQVRPFDANLMAHIYERPFSTILGPVPAAREAGQSVGGHRDGCRLGFDLGASDYKVAAMRDGAVVFSAEFPWNPKDQPDPEYHYRRLNDGLRQAARHLTRVDAIGGSTAGVVVDNQLKVASLFRAVPANQSAAAQNIFHRLHEEWRVPVTVANDGDVTALAGAMTLGDNAVLGVAMGSSEAAGFIDGAGRLGGGLNELAFAPVDEHPDAVPDEWSGDRGVGAQYFSQQAVNKLLPAAGLSLPVGMALPERLTAVQELIARGDDRAARIYETIGVYLGYTIPWYAEFYEFRHLLVLGRVLTGRGGEILIAKARAVLTTEFPEVAARISLHVPEESSRRIGQAVAAASLPVIPR